MTAMRSLLCALLVSIGVAVHAQEAAEPIADPVVGVWQLDLARSRYEPGPPPLREIRTYEHEHEGIRATILTIDAQGRESRVEYLASYNDVVAIVTGSDRTDAIKMRKIDDTTAESTLSYQGKVVGLARRVISRDGRTMTITLRRDEPTRVDNVAVYTRFAGEP